MVLRLVYIVNGKVVILGLRDHERCLRVGQGLGSSKGGILAITRDGDLTDGIDAHGVTHAGNRALIVVIEQVAKDKVGTKGGQERICPQDRIKLIERQDRSPIIPSSTSLERCSGRDTKDVI